LETKTIIEEQSKRSITAIQSVTEKDYLVQGYKKVVIQSHVYTHTQKQKKKMKVTQGKCIKKRRTQLYDIRLISNQMISVLYISLQYERINGHVESIPPK
jgi:hypothetical protein